MLELTGQGPRIVGMLSLRFDEGAWSGHVEGGPVEVAVDGSTLRIIIDSRDLQGFVFNRILDGRYDGETLGGKFLTEGPSYADEPGGDWIGVRKAPQRPRLPPAPVDISGLWQPGPGIDFRKYKMDLTPEAQAWFDDYLMHYDQPNVRCVSPGIVAMVAWGGYPMEILESDNRLTFLYEVESEVRRVFLDGKSPPEFFPTSPMGWSNGYWDGSDLVVETQLIEGNVRDFRGGAGIRRCADARTLLAQRGWPDAVRGDFAHRSRQLSVSADPPQAMGPQTRHRDLPLRMRSRFLLPADVQRGPTRHVLRALATASDGMRHALARTRPGRLGG